MRILLVEKCHNANAVEATWLDRVVLPAPDDDEAGVDLVYDTQIRCHCYADVQMSMLRDDVAKYGGNIDELEQLIAEIEAGIVPPPPMSREDRIAHINGLVTDMLDTVAQKRNYRDIQSAALRASRPGPFYAEGCAYYDWQDACWARCYEILAEVDAGTRSAPTDEELLAELPVLVLP